MKNPVSLIVESMESLGDHVHENLQRNTFYNQPDQDNPLLGRNAHAAQEVIARTTGVQEKRGVDTSHTTSPPTYTPFTTSIPTYATSGTTNTPIVATPPHCQHRYARMFSREEKPKQEAAGRTNNNAAPESEQADQGEVIRVCARFLARIGDRLDQVFQEDNQNNNGH